MAQYEVRSFKKPLLRGHAPIALEPADVTEMKPSHVGDYFDGTPVMELRDVTRPGDVTPLDESLVMEEVKHLASNPDFFQLTICEVATDGKGNIIARGTPHHCGLLGNGKPLDNLIAQVQAYLDEGK